MRLRLHAPVWLREIALLGFWTGAAVNVFIYTYKSYARTYKRPALKAWQKTASDVQPLPATPSPAAAPTAPAPAAPAKPSPSPGLPRARVLS